MAVLLAACSGEGTDRSAADATTAATDTTQRMRALAVPITPNKWVAVTQPKDVLLQNLAIPADAPTRGMWSAVGPWPMNGLHQAVLPDGKVLTWGTTPDGGGQNGRYFDVWDPNRGLFDAGAHNFTYDPNRQDSFCAPSVYLADGRLMMTGGNANLGNQTYSPSTGAFAPAANLADARWYATMLKLADGRPIVIGGIDPYTEGQWENPDVAVANGQSSMTPEVFDNGAWRSLLNARSRAAFGPDFLRASLPKAWLAPDGRVFGIGTDQMYYIDANAAGGQGTTTIVGGYKAPPNAGATADTALNVGPTMSGVMFAPGKVLTVGGNSYQSGSGNFGSRRATLIDINGGGAAMTEQPAMANARNFANTIVLPDGKVLVTGGETRALNDPAFAVYAAEAWNPATGTWATWANAGVFRGYHSQTSLLTNGTVLSSGGGTPGPVQLKGEVFYPPYLFRTVGATAQLAPRPQIVGISGLSYANAAPMQFDLANSGTISQVALIGVSIGTHSFNSGQRRIPLVFTQDGNRITTTLPVANLAPPGYYQVVALDAVGVPSRGTIIAVGQGVNPPTVPVTPYNPPDLSAPIAAPAVTVGGTVSYTYPATNGMTFSWSFGDGSAATAFSASATVTRTFANPGVYGVTLTARSASGAISTRSFLQAVGGARTAVQPTASSALALEARAGASTRLWVANPDTDTVAVLDSTTNARVAELAVGRQPVSVAVAGNGRVWVVNKGAASLSIINAATLAVEETVALPAGSQPHGLAFAPGGAVAYVALEGAGQLLKLDGVSAAQAGALNLPGAVRQVSVRGDGSQVLVTRFITAALPGEGTAAVNTAAAGAEVHVVAAATMTLARTVLLRHSDKADSEAQGSGIPNYLGAAVISPDGKSAWVPSKQDNIKRGVLRNGQNLDFQNTVRAISSRIDLATLAEDYPRRVDHDNASLGSAAAFHPNGAYLFVALETSRQVAVVDAYGGRELFRVDVGRAPQGVAVSADGRTLYVQNFMDRTVSVLDLSGLTNQGLAQLPAKANTGTVAAEKLAANVLLGKQLFYDARDPRLARDSYMSCAACHNDGGHDGRTWDLTGLGEGLRNTISLKGHAGMGQGLLHWSGNFDEVQDFEGQIRGLAGGTGLMPDALYFVGTRSTPLGDKKAGLSAELDALAAYVGSLTTTDRSPWRNADGTLSAATVAGKAVFDNNNCASCHGGPNFTSSSLNGGMRGVGTTKAASGNRLGAPLTGLDVPTLRGVWATAPYLHDGSAATLDAAVAAHTGNPVAAADLPNLAAYLRSIDNSDAAPPQPLPDGVYRLVAQHSGQALNVTGISVADGAGATQWPWANGDNQRWKLTRQADGSVTLAAQHSGKLLEVAGCSLADAARVQQWPANGAPCQRWKLQVQPDGSFTLANANSGKLMNVGGASLGNDAPVIQWPTSNAANERWRLEPVSANSVAAGYYNLANVNSGKVLDVAGVSPTAGANVHQWTATGGLNQQWNITPTADGYYELAPAHASTMRLEVAAGAPGNGGNVQQGLASGSAAQRWAFERQPDGSWRLTNRNSGRALDVAGVSLVDGANVHQWDWLNSANQRWTLRALAAPPAPVLAAGQGVGLEPLTLAGYRVRHAGYLGYIAQANAASPLIDKQDSSFTARTGLGNAACWSFESKNFPGYYLGQDGTTRLVLAARIGSYAFNAQATFCARAPLNGTGGAGTLTLESQSTPGRYIRHRNFEVWLDNNDGSALFAGDATFRVQPALAP